MNIPKLNRKLPELLKSFVIALALLLFLHLFVIRWVTVRSTSMYATLLPGDLMGVVRWPTWTGFHRGDIVVFHDPVQDDRRMGRRQLLVKRIVGLPGDKVELRGSDLYVNDVLVPLPEHATERQIVRMRKDSDAASVLQELGLPPDAVLPGTDILDLPINSQLAAQLEKRDDVISVVEHSSPTGAPDHLFPFSRNYRWNNDRYGPIDVPAKGDSVAIVPYTLPLYDRIISNYEGNKVGMMKNAIWINDTPAKTYVVKKDYYFVLGDSRDNSADSRYWGFLPADHLVGRATFVLFNAQATDTGLRAQRSLKEL